MIGKRLVAITVGAFIVIAGACQGDGSSTTSGNPDNNPDNKGGNNAAASPATQPAQADGQARASMQGAPDKPAIAADIDPASVELPPIDGASQFTPMEGDQLERARQSLDELLEDIDKPDHLTTAQATQPDDAQPAERAATGEPPLEAQRAYVAGRQAWHEGNTFEAISELERALRLAPRRPQLLRLLGRIYTDAGNTVRGAVQLKEAVRLEPTDIESIFMLGRFALQDGRVDEAIVTFHHALTLARESEQANSARVPVLHYYLGDALARAGYAAAAIEQHRQFQAHATGRLRYTQSGRALAILRERSGLTWRAVGDMQHRLDKPAEALKAYQKAFDNQEQADVDAELVARLLYTHLRLNDAQSAYELAVEHMRQSGADDTSLALVRYITEQGIAGDALADRLRAVYDREGRPAALAMAIADLLPDEQGRALLSAHIKQAPGDARVFTKIIERLMPDGAAQATAAQRADAMAVTIDAMAGASEHVQARAEALFEAAGDVQPLIEAFDELGEGQRNAPMAHLLRGFALMQVGDADEAVEPLRQALEASPDLRPARLALARLAIVQQDYARARQLLEPLEGSDAPEVLSLRVEVLAQTGEVEQATELLNKRIAQGGADADLLLQKASLQLRADKAAEAERTLLDALNAHPEDERLYTALLRLYEPQGDESSPIDDAERQRRRVISRMMNRIPESRRAQLVRAELLIEGQQWAQAEQVLRQLVDDKGADPEAVQRLLELYFRTNQRERAITLLDEQIDAHPDNRRLLALALDVFSNQNINESERALDVANRLIELEPTDPGVVYRLTRLYVEADEPAKAIPVIEAALESDDVGDPSTFTQLLWQAMWNDDRGDEAIKRLDALAEQFNEHAPDILMQKSYLLQAMGEKQRAEQVLLDVLEQHPDHAATNNALGYTWADEGRHLEQAREMIKKAVDAEPGTSSYLDSLGWVHYKLGNFEQAVQWLRRAQAAGGGSHPVIVDHLGDALYRTGNQAEAQQQWRRTMLLLRQQPPRLSPNPELDGMQEELREKINSDDPPIAPVPEQGGGDDNGENQADGNANGANADDEGRFGLELGDASRIDLGDGQVIIQVDRLRAIELLDNGQEIQLEVEDLKMQGEEVLLEHFLQNAGRWQRELEEDGDNRPRD